MQDSSIRFFTASQDAFYTIHNRKAAGSYWQHELITSILLAAENYLGQRGGSYPGCRLLSTATVSSGLVGMMSSGFSWACAMSSMDGLGYWARGIKSCCSLTLWKTSLVRSNTNHFSSSIMHTFSICSNSLGNFILQLTSVKNTITDVQESGWEGLSRLNSAQVRLLGVAPSESLW